VIHGDSAKLMPKFLKPDSVDLVATDPPYGIKLMNNSWDEVLPDKKIWEACYKAMRPGAFLVAMSATRMYHRLACDIEDVGFKIKDALAWTYASGFPHGKDISKEIDREKGLKRKIIGKRKHPTLRRKPKVKSRAYLTHSLNSDENLESWDITEPACEESTRLQGYNTHLKPAIELLTLAQKPYENTIVENVLKYGTGVINIDDCRIPYLDEKDKDAIGSFEHFEGKDYGDKKFFSANADGKKQVNIHPGGRYPSNLMYSEPLFGKDYDKIFMIPKPSSNEKFNAGHDTVKPIELFCRLISLFSPNPSAVKRNVLVVDSFCGSGTTGISCKKMSRDFMGFEIDKDMCEQARKRISGYHCSKDIFLK